MRKLSTVSRRSLAAFALCACVLQTFVVSAPAQIARASKATIPTLMSDEQRILHVLNRLGFGARPGDVERVRQIGVARYIALQLQPERIDDMQLEARLKEFKALELSTAELLAKYPTPAMLVRRLQSEGRLPADLAALRGIAPESNGKERGNNRQSAQLASEMNESGMANDSASSAMARRGEDAKAAGDRREFRQAVRRYYAENDLLQPQLIMQELHASRILRAAYSERQLQEVMVDFWTNHFNVFAGKGATRWFLPAYDRSVIRPNALGNFRDLLRHTAESSAMLFYLDNFQSVSSDAPQGAGRRPGISGNMRRRSNRAREIQTPQEMNAQEMNAQEMNAQGMSAQGMNASQDDMTALRRPQQQQRQRRARRGINENYARELMELHTLGVEGGYTQADIVEVARAFTGWTIINPRGYNRSGGGRLAEESTRRAGTFYFNSRQHDTKEKIVLGNRIRANGGIEDGLKVIDILARHPSTARFIATKLCRRFVADDPAPALVARVAAAFTSSDGDIRETLRAIFVSPEFNSSNAFQVKIKTPFEFVVSALRALDAETNARPALHDKLARMGEPLYGYQAPTGYPDTAAAWVNTGALLERLNFALALTANRIPGTSVSIARVLDGQPQISDSKSKQRVVEELLRTILNGQVSEGTRRTLLKQVVEQPMSKLEPKVDEADTVTAERGMGTRRGGRKRNLTNEVASNLNPEEAELRRIIGLVIGTPEFQRQ